MHGVRFHLDHSFSMRHMSRYVDDDLAPSARHRVATHIAGCESCRFAERSLRLMLERLHGLRRRRRPAMTERVVARLRTEEADRPASAR